jgi:ferredoxin
MKSTLMKVTVDQNICASAGNCVMNAPEVFDQRDEDGVVVLLSDHPSAEQTDGVRQAAAACPAQAINIEE